MWNPNPSDSKAIAQQIFVEIQRLREDIVRLQEQQKTDVSYRNNLDSVKTSLSDLSLLVRDNTQWIQDQKSAQEKRADRIANGSYGILFNWIQAIITAISIASLSWILAHQSPVLKPSTEPPNIQK